MIYKKSMSPEKIHPPLTAQQLVDLYKASIEKGTEIEEFLAELARAVPTLTEEGAQLLKKTVEEKEKEKLPQ